MILTLDIASQCHITDLLRQLKLLKHESVCSSASLFAQFDSTSHAAARTGFLIEVLGEHILEL